MDYIASNWQMLLVYLGTAVALLSAVNSASLHWRSLVGPWYARILPSVIMLLTELASIRTSSNAYRRGWKLPLTSVPSEKPTDGSGSANALLIIAITIACFISLTLATGCGASWKDIAAQSLNGIKAGADATQKISAREFHKKCRGVAAKCEVKAADCEPLQKCQGERRDFNSVLVKVYDGLDIARVTYAGAIVASKPGSTRRKLAELLALLARDYSALVAIGARLGVLKVLK